MNKQLLKIRHAIRNSGLPWKAFSIKKVDDTIVVKLKPDSNGHYAEHSDIFNRIEVFEKLVNSDIFRITVYLNKPVENGYDYQVILQTATDTLTPGLYYSPYESWHVHKSQWRTITPTTITNLHDLLFKDQEKQDSQTYLYLWSENSITAIADDTAIRVSLADYDEYVKNWIEDEISIWETSGFSEDELGDMPESDFCKSDELILKNLHIPLIVANFGEQNLYACTEYFGETVEY